MTGKFWKGFSWIQLLGLLIVAGVLLLLTVPNFAKFQCRAAQSVAKYEMPRIYAAVALYKKERGEWPTLADLRRTQRAKIDNDFYEFELVYPESGGYQLRAIGLLGTRVALDVWEMKGAHQVANLHNVCAIP